MSTFTDHFSKQSQTYARYRPTYPPELFSYLAQVAPSHDLAWDCATGNGQAALGLAAHFRKVYATDPSANQVANAIPHPAITYNIEQAEACGLEADSADIVTVAQGLHWFNFDHFHAEVKRVLRPGGILAAWCYGLPTIAPAVDKLIRHYHDVTVDAYWQYENRLIESGYSTIPFPYKLIEAPSFKMTGRLDLNGLAGLLGSWSATQKMIDATGLDPLPELMEKLHPVWGNAAAEKELTWTALMKVGRHV